MDIEDLQNRATHGDTRRGTDSGAWKRALQENLFYVLGRFPATATLNDKYLALAYSVRDRLLERWVKTSETYYRKKARTVCYLSAEFLLGPHLGNNLVNLDAFETAKQGMEELGLDFEKLLDQEEEPGLGSGGGSRPASSIPSRRCRFHRSATASATSSGFSTSRYEMAVK